MIDRKEELIQRVKAIKKKLEADLSQLRADTTGHINDEKEKKEGQLNRAKELIKEAANDFSEKISKKISDWLK